MIVHFLVRTESISVTEVSKIINCSEVCFNSHFTLIFYLYILMLVTFQAIHKFSQARPPGIYKQDYIDSLYMFFNERKPESLVCPQTPEWKSLPDPDFHGVSVSATDNYADILQEVHAHFVCITWLSFQKIWLQLVCTYDSVSLVMFLFYFCSREFDIAFKYNWLHSASFCLSSYTLMYYTCITFCWR